MQDWQPPVCGEMIMKEFNIGPGKKVGAIKNIIRDAILDGIIPNEPEMAKKLMIQEEEQTK